MRFGGWRGSGATGEPSVVGGGTQGLFGEAGGTLGAIGGGLGWFGGSAWDLRALPYCDVRGGLGWSSGGSRALWSVWGGSVAPKAPPHSPPDQDECAEGSHDCGGAQSCLNTFGGHLCIPRELCRGPYTPHPRGNGYGAPPTHPKTPGTGYNPSMHPQNLEEAPRDPHQVTPKSWGVPVTPPGGWGKI